LIERLPRSVRLVAGLVGMVLLAGAVTLAVSYGRGYYDSRYEVSAVFPTSSQGLFTDGGTDVKMRGLNVGTVSGVELLPDGRARIMLRLDAEVRVPASSTASIEPLSVFGPKFVRIEPGPDDGTVTYLGAGDEITSTRTATELTTIIAGATELLGAVEPGDVRAIVDAVSEGIGGLGTTMGRGIDQTAALLDVGAAHAGDVRAFLADLAVLSGTVADHRDDLVATIDDVAELAATFADHAGDLDALLDRTVAISGAFTVLLDDHRADFAATVEALAQFVHGIYGESARIPDLIDLLGTFFGRLSDVIRLQGPSGTTLAGLRGFVELDLCLLYGICPS
jgi:phospholipid/cholesterol/gamma-HCH transport system substrate-binding protein